MWKGHEELEEGIIWKTSTDRRNVVHAFNDMTALGRQKQAELCEASLVYRARSVTAKVIQCCM